MGSKQGSWEELACESLRLGTSSSTKISLNSCSHFRDFRTAWLETVNNGSPGSILVLFCFWIFCLLGPQGVAPFNSPFSHQHRKLTQALERYHLSFYPLLESHNHLMMLLVKKTSLRKKLEPDSPFLNVSLKLNEPKLEDDLVEMLGTTIGTQLSVSHCIRIPFLTGCVCWPPIYSWEYPFASQRFPSDNIVDVFSMTFIVKNMSNSLTSTVATSCVCTYPLEVLTIVGLHDFVKVSISASLKSFLLIMCIDAPESTTNSHSSGFNVDAGRHLFSEGEKNIALSCSFSFQHIFGQLPHCVAGTLLLPLCPLLGPILEFWSVGGMLLRFTWANQSERRILVSNFSSVTCNGPRELHTLDWFLHVWALPSDWRQLRRLHVLTDATQLSCIRWSAVNRSVI